LGGHTHTIEVPQADQSPLGVDTGFIVFNDRNYPHFVKFLEELRVPSQPSNMSFSYHSPSKDFYYAGINFDSLFAQRRNFFRAEIWRMLCEIPRFYGIGSQLLSESSELSPTLGELLKKHRFNEEFKSLYLLPMSAAIWSTPVDEILEYPAISFLKFWKNHGLLSLIRRPQWRVVQGGSAQYIKRFREVFKGRILSSSRVTQVTRSSSRVRLQYDDQSLDFDQVVFAIHADQVLPILLDATEHEKKLFSCWRYQRNTTLLHTDERVLPPHRKAWASWNYREFESSRLAVTYYMNRLQNLQTKKTYCVSLNWPETGPEAIDEGKILKRILYEHPTYTSEALATQQAIADLSGSHRTHFCGSYLGHGFHEDAIRSSAFMARKLGVWW
jgi:predicted NAD/FAD-binding protein